MSRHLSTHNIIISGFGIYGAAVVSDSGVGNTWQRLTLVLHEFLSNISSKFMHAFLIGTNLIHDFTAVTFSVKLTFFREKCPIP